VAEWILLLSVHEKPGDLQTPAVGMPILFDDMAKSFHMARLRCAQPPNGAGSELHSALSEDDQSDPCCFQKRLKIHAYDDILGDLEGKK